MSGGALQDWTEGYPGIVTYRCGDCHKPFYFQRPFCPACGSTSVTASQSPGLGTVQARTLLYRAPTEALRDHTPYLITLVEMEDGYTVMGHGDRALAIGDRVRADFIAFGDRPAIPYFVPFGGSDD